MIELILCRVLLPGTASCSTATTKQLEDLVRDTVQSKVAYLPEYKQSQIDLARSFLDYFQSLEVQVDIMLEQRGNTEQKKPPDEEKVRRFFFCRISTYFIKDLSLSDSTNLFASLLVYTLPMSSLSVATDTTHGVGNPSEPDVPRCVAHEPEFCQRQNQRLGRQSGLC